MMTAQERIDTRLPGAVLIAGSVLATVAIGPALVVTATTGIVRLNVGGMMLALVVWALWFVAVGALMVLGKI